MGILSTIMLADEAAKGKYPPLDDLVLTVSNPSETCQWDFWIVVAICVTVCICAVVMTCIICSYLRNNKKIDARLQQVEALLKNFQDNPCGKSEAPQAECLSAERIQEIREAIVGEPGSLEKSGIEVQATISDGRNHVTFKSVGRKNTDDK